MKIKEIIEKIEEFAPISISEDLKNSGHYDNSGLMLGDVEKEVTKVIICIDVCDFIVDMAIANNSNFIISHHPFIYMPIKSITNNDYKGQLIQKLIKNDITVYSAHLNFDYTKGGIDDEVANLLGISVKKVYDKRAHGGYGKFGSIKPMKLADYIEEIKKNFDVVKSTNENRIVETAVSFCGSGVDQDAVKFAIDNKADLVISCDIQHHFVVELAENGISVIGLSHGESELKAFVNIIRQEKLLNYKDNLSIQNLVFEKDFRLV